jgi:hypothetical protein
MSIYGDRPMCPTCKHPMGLARISPGERGFEDRTLECTTCHRTEKRSFALDPMKPDAVGWLASEINRPYNNSSAMTCSRLVKTTIARATVSIDRMVSRMTA